MKRTKTRNVKAANSTSKSSDVKNIATQTTDIDSFIEIAKLQEQLKLLKLENDILRKHMQTSDKFDNVTHHVPQIIAQPVIPKINVDICRCKGTCSSKICGCMKKNNRCNPSCKCDDKLCKNQKLKEDQEQENKENISRSDMQTPKKQVKTKENEITKETKSSNIKNDKMSDTEIQFDPMKPRHQLLRTPPNYRKVDNTIPSQSMKSEPHQEMPIISSNIKEIEEEIDWEQHTVKLIPCKKCKRTFMPHRIKKHEACCKKI